MIRVAKGFAVAHEGVKIRHHGARGHADFREISLPATAASSAAITSIFS